MVTLWATKDDCVEEDTKAIAWPLALALGKNQGQTKIFTLIAVINADRHRFMDQEPIAIC